MGMATRRRARDDAWSIGEEEEEEDGEALGSFLTIIVCQTRSQRPSFQKDTLPANTQRSSALFPFGAFALEFATREWAGEARGSLARPRSRTSDLRARTHRTQGCEHAHARTHTQPDPMLRP